MLPLERARYYPMVRLCSLITSIYYMEKSTSHRIRLALVIYSRVVVQMMSCLSAECGGKYPTKSKSFTLHTDNLYFHDLKEITLHGHEWLSERGISLSQTSEEACEKVCRIYHFFSLLVFFSSYSFFLKHFSRPMIIYFGYCWRYACGSLFILLQAFDFEHQAQEEVRSQSNLGAILPLMFRREQRAAILPQRSTKSGHLQSYATGPQIRDLIVCTCFWRMKLQWNKSKKRFDYESLGIDDDDEEIGPMTSAETLNGSRKLPQEIGAYNWRYVAVSL